jgi:1-phosphatidylinositol-4-phosphate 5-kinase
MTGAEVRLFRDLLPAYRKHFEKNKDSLIAKIYGMYRVKISWMDGVTVLLMENTLQVKDSSCIERVFDLKGSTVARNVKISRDQVTGTKTLKDVNFTTLKAGLPLTANHMTAVHKKLINTVRADVDFLRKSKLMDYSMLIGVEKASE